MFSFDDYHVDLTVAEGKHIVLSVDKDNSPIKRVYSGKMIEERKQRTFFERFGGILISILAMLIIVGYWRWRWCIRLFTVFLLVNEKRINNPYLFVIQFIWSPRISSSPFHQLSNPCLFPFHWLTDLLFSVKISVQCQLLNDLFQIWNHLKECRIDKYLLNVIEHIL